MPLHRPVVNPDGQRALYEREVKRRIVALFEDLVRHDENLGAWRLISEAVPYFLVDDPEIVQLRSDQRERVEHILHPEAYRRYYSTNPDERPFEEMYGVSPQRAHEYLFRVGWLRERLTALAADLDIPHSQLRVLDLACNDGMLAVNLWDWAGIRVDGVDLNPSCVERARKRADDLGMPGDFDVGDVCEDYPSYAEEGRPPVGTGGHHAVVAFELIEHVPDPHRLLKVMAAGTGQGGRMYLSTPVGAVEQGLLEPGTPLAWDRRGRRGHVRAFLPDQMHQMCSLYGKTSPPKVGVDGVMVLEVQQ